MTTMDPPRISTDTDQLVTPPVAAPTPVVTVTVTPPADTAGEAGTGEKPRISPAFIVMYMLASFGVWAATVGVVAAGLAVRVAEINPEGYAALYSLVAGVGTLIAIPVGPIFGRLSDVSKSRFGRRAPVVMVGMLSSVTGGVLLAFTTDTAMLLIAWGFVMAGNSIVLPPFWAIIGDRVPKQLQGRMTGLAGTAQSISMLVTVWYVSQASTTVEMLIVPPVVGTILVLAFLIYLRDRQVVTTEKFKISELFSGMVFNPIKERRLAGALLAIGLFTGGQSVAGTYLVYFLQVYMGLPEEQALSQVFMNSLILNGVGLAAAPLFGWLSDKIRSRAIVFGAGAVFVAAGTLTMLGGTLESFYLGSALLGLGSGIYGGQSVAIVLSATRTSSEAGRNLGLSSLGMQLTYAFVPLLAPVLLGMGGGDSNYAALFIAGAVLMLVILPLLMISFAKRKATPLAE